MTLVSTKRQMPHVRSLETSFFSSFASICRPMRLAAFAQQFGPIRFDLTSGSVQVPLETKLRVESVRD
jgi:hypothetical protein